MWENVRTTNREYKAAVDKWKRIDDTMKGTVLDYLRNVGKSEATVEAQKERQSAYEDGAIFYNFSKRTVDGMIGSIMRKEPEVDIPTKIQYVLADCDGSGQGLVQQSQDSARQCLMKGRGGLFTDVPASPVGNDGQPMTITRQQEIDGVMNPRVQLYVAESIINWRVERLGSANKLTMIVLAESYEYQDAANEFNWLAGTQYRVLDFDEGGYRQRVFKFADDGSFLDEQEFYPKANGQRLQEIPFAFFGADNNDYTVDESPILPLVDINIAHFRNCADNEEQLFVAAQAMLVIAPEMSIAKDWAKHNPNGVRFGARSGLNVGQGGNAFLLQAASSNALSEAIQQKENQAIMIGAQLITPSQQITAESARLQRGADTSVLSSVANNVSDAYRKALKWCCDFLGDSGDVNFELNTDFFMQAMTAQDRQAWAADINAGLLPASEYYKALRKSGITSATDDEIEKELELQGGLGGIPEGDLPVDDETGDEIVE